jgi:predicted nucleotidyltransferase component of viral defense system
MKNPIASIQARLKNVAQAENKTYQMILIRYFIERLIYRLSISPFKPHFCLKGGALLYAFEREASRPTMDLDLLGLNLASEQTHLKSIFQSIAPIACEMDGVFFLEQSITTHEIQKEGKYTGIRVKIEARLGNIRHFLQIDIGFGDAVTPAPVEMSYPTLLSMPIPEILAYSVESVIAEKFEAMIDLADQNSRMKDFYDVYKLLQKGDFDLLILEMAIQNTFKRRGTLAEANHVLFTQPFMENPQRHLDWKGFLTKMNQPSIRFQTVLQRIVEQLKPIYDKL